MSESCHLPKRVETHNVLSAFVALLMFVVALFPGNAFAFSSADAPQHHNAEEVVEFEHTLDSYTPKKKSYNFYFAYKTVHPWWDAVALGIEDAQRQFLKRGVTITYEYRAPNEASAQYQISQLQSAANGPFDVIAVDVADEAIVSPVLDRLVDSGKKVMTFSSSDAADGCKRIAYVGNTHNYEDGVLLTHELCAKLGYAGKVAILAGNEGAPCHEDRARGAKETIAKFEGMEVVDVLYDRDSIERATELTNELLQKHSDLAGIICCNMSNPVGAARAVTASGRNVTIVGMDHDKEALRYLRDGTIHCLGVQDCYSIGFDTLQTAVKIADGVPPGELYPTTQDESTTFIYQDDAKDMLEMLYGEIERSDA